MELSHIYNPANQTADELIENFVIRNREFQNLMADIRRDKMKHPPQHYIIQGQRGAGKTTLLLRVYYEIKRDDELIKWMLPIVFREEQYNVRTLFKFWEELAHYLERESDLFYGLVDSLESLHYADFDEYEEKLYDLISAKIEEGEKKITLLVDNIGMLFSKFSKRDQQRLREVLLTNNNLRIIGASAYVMEAVNNYLKPFYEFFKVINLNPLHSDETKTLLIALDRKFKSGSIPKIIREQPERVEALRRITGGVPRSIVLLFEIFSDNERGNSMKDLEVILDKVTPLYKHRMDDLSAQQQEITHIIAMNWDAVSVAEIAKKAKLESKKVSSQLTLMVASGLINKIQTSTKNNLYQLNERFFNIWYLMRFGVQKERDKVKWLLKFLEVWCASDVLPNRVDALAKSSNDPSCEVQEEKVFYPLKPNTENEEIERLNKIACVHFYSKENKQKAIGLARKAYEKPGGDLVGHVFIIMLLWDNQIVEAKELCLRFFNQEEVYEDISVVSLLMELLMAKKQFHFLLKLFKENNFDIKDRFKAHYYVLMHFMRKDFPNEYLKMGGELKQTVEEIIAKTEKMAIDYE